MVRVLKPGGKLVMIDMEAADEVLRNTEDEIETQRDPSHVKNLSKAEMLNLFGTHGLAVEKCETTDEIRTCRRGKNRLFSLCGEWNHLFQPKMAAADGKKAVAKPAWPAAVQTNATYPPPAFASGECPCSLLD